MVNKISADKIREITTMNRFNSIMKDFFKGYPAYEYFGIFEYYFGVEAGKRMVNLLEKDRLIEVIRKENTPIRYRISGEGIKFVIAMRNFDIATRLNWLTAILVGFGFITICIMGAQLVFQILQYLK